MKRGRPGRMARLLQRHPHLRPWVVGHGGMGLEERFGTGPMTWAKA